MYLFIFFLLIKANKDIITVKVANNTNTSVGGMFKSLEIFIKVNKIVMLALKIMLNSMALINPISYLSGYNTAAKAYPGKTNNNKKQGINLIGNWLKGVVKTKTEATSVIIITK